MSNEDRLSVFFEREGNRLKSENNEWSAFSAFCAASRQQLSSFGHDEKARRASRRFCP
jgi:hypothetical protein